MNRFGIVICGLLAACGGGVNGNPGGDNLQWEVPGVRVTAARFTAQVEGVTFHGTNDVTELSGSPDSDKITFDWTEQGYAERFYLHFATTAGTWYADDVRIYNLAATDWHETKGHFFGAQLGASYTADTLTLPIDAAATIELRGVTISPYQP